MKYICKENTPELLQYLQETNPKEKQRLYNIVAEQYFYMVQSQTQNYYDRHYRNSTLDYNDMCSYAADGLMQALQKYDPKKNDTFVKYLAQQINYRIIDRLRVVNPYYKRYKAEYNQKFYGTNKKRIFSSSPEVYSLDSEHPDYDTDQYSVYAAKKESKTFEDKETFLSMIEKLSEREQYIIYLYYWEGNSMAEIGKIQGSSESRVSQIISNALKKMKTHIRDQKNRMAFSA